MPSLRSVSLYFAIAIFGVFLGFGIASVRTPENPTIEKTVTSEAILTSLKDRGFLVTQTLVFDLPITIDKTSGSAFKDFFIGQTITARGLMEANLGIELADLKKEDFAMSANELRLNIPTSTIFNVRPLGPIQLQNQRGILKRILGTDPGYNEALAELTKLANETAQHPDIIAKAQKTAQEELQRLLRLQAPTDFRIVID